MALHAILRTCWRADCAHLRETRERNSRIKILIYLPGISCPRIIFHHCEFPREKDVKEVGSRNGKERREEKNKLGKRTTGR